MVGTASKAKKERVYRISRQMTGRPLVVQTEQNSEEGSSTHSGRSISKARPEGLDAYYHLPVKIWGTITSVNSQGVATVQLDRYEPLYSDEKAQILFGEEKVTQVEGVDVLLFTADDGTSYVRNDSLQYGVLDLWHRREAVNTSLRLMHQTFGGIQCCIINTAMSRKT
jgi:hypothetical protein